MLYKMDWNNTEKDKDEVVRAPTVASVGYGDVKESDNDARKLAGK